MQEYEFIKQIIEGGYSEYSENRLTKLFAAVYNSSKDFRTAFNEIWIQKKLRFDVYADTHVSYSNKYIPDLVIRNKETDDEVAIIEVKVDADLTEKQLNNYSKIVESKVIKIALVKHYFEFDVSGWKVIRWSQVFRLLSDKFKKDNYANILFSHLKEYGMASKNSITADQLRVVANYYYELKNGKHSEFSLNGSNPIMQAASIVEFVTCICDELKAISLKNVKTISPKFSYSNEHNEDGKKELAYRQLVVIVNLDKPMGKNKIHSIYFSIEFSLKEKNEFIVSIKEVGPKDGYGKYFYHNEKVINNEEFTIDDCLREIVKKVG